MNEPLKALWEEEMRGYRRPERIAPLASRDDLFELIELLAHAGEASRLARAVLVTLRSSQAEWFGAEVLSAWHQAARRRADEVAVAWRLSGDERALYSFYWQCLDTFPEDLVEGELLEMLGPPSSEARNPATGSHLMWYAARDFELFFEANREGQIVAWKST